MSVLSKRYAEALLETAAEKKMIDVYTGQLQELSVLFSRDEKLQHFLADPEVRRAEKKRVLREALEKGYNPDIVNFLLLLVDKERIKFLKDISYDFELLADRFMNILRLKVISAKPLESHQLDKIKETYRLKYNSASVKAETIVDDTLIGGIKVIIGDSVIDGSIKGRLEGLRDLIIERGRM